MLLVSNFDPAPCEAASPKATTDLYQIEISDDEGDVYPSPAATCNTVGMPSVLPAGMFVEQ